MQSAARPDDLPPASEEGLELLDDGSAAQHQASPLPLWATRGCGLVLMLLLAANFIAAVVIWATPHPTRGTGVPVHRVSVQAQTNHSPATVVSSESYDYPDESYPDESYDYHDESYDYPHDPHSARACVYDNGSPFIKRGSQLDSCGRDAYCCAGGEQAGKSNCENAMSAQQTALALGVSAASIRACCHFGGYGTSAPAHVTVAADSLGNAHRPCPQLASG
jgi:hypothetical protein